MFLTTYAGMSIRKKNISTPDTTNITVYRTLFFYRHPNHQPQIITPHQQANEMKRICQDASISMTPAIPIPIPQSRPPRSLHPRRRGAGPASPPSGRRLRTGGRRSRPRPPHRRPRRRCRRTDPPPAPAAAASNVNVVAIVVVAEETAAPPPPPPP